FLGSVALACPSAAAPSENAASASGPSAKKESKKEAKKDSKKKVKKKPGKASQDDKSEDVKPAGFAVEKPSAETQTQKSAEERGINPCNTPDHGWGSYDKWSRAPSMGQLIMPSKKTFVAKDGGFDVMFHF